ncbi:MAG: hypothetical protein IPG71_04560 [bacterium]|nr:hypothetical protein [bacterium]
MNYSHHFLLTLSIACWLAAVSDAGGQCQTSALVSPGTNEPLASYTVSISTTDIHCLAGGSFNIMTLPPGAVMFENGIDSFFDVFLDVSMDHHVRDVGLTPILPPGMPFQMITNINYDDPWYPPQVLVEDVWVNPGNGRFEYFRTVTPPQSVPPMLSPGESFCFIVIHQVYHIPLMVPPGMGQPVISVSPGCTPMDPCPDMMPCTPGGPNDFRADVIFSGGQWILEFEYSNPMIEPACYCVSYTGNLPLGFAPVPLLGLDERTQEFTLSMSSLGGNPICGNLELFSYPDGLQLGAPPAPWFMSIGEGDVIARGEIGRGDFTPGQTVKLVAHLNFSELCGDADDMWVIEDLRVTAEGLLAVADLGGQCVPASVHVPGSMEFGEAQCIEVCHDVYYIQLNAPPDATPSVTVTPGCNPPCTPIEPCTPGALEHCVYWVERIGSHWYLRFEYSNPMIEPVCYCLYYDGLGLNPPQGSVLAALDEQTQFLNVSLWNSQPMTPLSGTLTLSQVPSCNPPWYWVDSFFDVFTVPRQWELPPDRCVARRGKPSFSSST